jgi:hypothetical protein
MDDIELAILDAWRRLAPQLARDPAELRRRLDRRDRSRTLARPPRALCLAVRATDTRLDALLRPAGAPPRALGAQERAQHHPGRADDPAPVRSGVPRISRPHDRRGQILVRITERSAGYWAQEHIAPLQPRPIRC